MVPSLLLALAACTPGNPKVEETGTEPPPFTCDGDNDGVIEAGEMDASIGARAMYLANAQGQDTTVDIDSWDFTTGPSDVSVTFEVKDPAGQWWSPSFPDASFASPFFVYAPTELGIFRQDASGLTMLGLASETEEGDTLLVYDPPVTVYQYPMEVGSTWSAAPTFTDALLQGVPNQGEERWTFTVDATGTARVPGFDLENALRIRLDLTQTWAVAVDGNTWSTIEYFYVRECVGEVARIVSRRDETDPHFTVAAEYRRWGG